MRGRVPFRLLTLALSWILMAAAGPANRPAAVSAPQAPPSRADAEALLADVRTLAGPDFAGRRTGTDGNRRARAFIVERFARIGLKPLRESFEHAFRLRSGRAQKDASEQASGVNVIGRLEGTREPDSYVLVTAHYDHLGARGGEIFPGADDNASGIAGMLAAAAFFAKAPAGASLLFVAFDAEEIGCLGARHFVRNPPIDLKRISAVVNLDMVARGDANTLWAAGTHHYPHLRAPVTEALQGRTLKVAFGHDRPQRSARDPEDWTHSSDHGPFHDAGVPFLYFGVEDHPDYHRPSDTPDRIPVRFFDEAIELVIETVRRLAGAS
jgi:hypothetical protein